MERLLQVFLSPTCRGIYEVSINTENGRMRCTCPGFKARDTCKHRRWVQNRRGEDGEFLVPLPPGVSESDIHEAGKDADTWRAFAIRTFRPEVL